MDLTTTTIASILALLVCGSATYNAYILRGGKMAMSQVMMALGMVSLIFSLIIDRMGVNFNLVEILKTSDLFFMAGFLLLLLASIRLRSALK